MVYFLVLLFFIPAWAAPQNFDLTGGFQGRTLPALGAEAYVDSGYNHLLWGEKKNSKDFKYGLIRPSLGARTSGVINTIQGKIEFFPISILGFSAGRQFTHSNYDFTFFNCEVVVCQGEFVRNFVETKMVLGYAGWVVVGSYKVDTLRSPSNNRPMADWRNVIVGEPGEEVQIDKRLIVGKQFSNKLVGVLIENAQFQGSGERKESFAAIYQERRNDTNYLIGAGAMHTSRQPMGFVLYFRIHHVALPSLKLF